MQDVSLPQAQTALQACSSGAWCDVKLRPAGWQANLSREQTE